MTPAQTSWIIDLANNVVGPNRRDNDWNYIEFAKALLAKQAEMPKSALTSSPTKEVQMGGCPACGRRDCVARACVNKPPFCPCHSPQTCVGLKESDGVRCVAQAIIL